MESNGPTPPSEGETESIPEETGKAQTGIDEGEDVLVPKQ